MASTIDMQFMRYLNLFEKVCKVSTTSCFVYNNVIVFAVPKSVVSKAVGKSGINMKKLSGILRKRIKVVTSPKGDEDIEKFISEVVDPISFSKFEFKDGLVTIGGGREVKATLIGRNRMREKELGEILKRFFGDVRLKIG